jgi:hypothetical protein
VKFEANSTPISLIFRIRSSMALFLTETSAIAILRLVIGHCVGIMHGCQPEECGKCNWQHEKRKRRSGSHRKASLIEVILRAT